MIHPVVQLMVEQLIALSQDQFYAHLQRHVYKGTIYKKGSKKRVTTAVQETLIIVLHKERAIPHASTVELIITGLELM